MACWCCQSLESEGQCWICGGNQGDNMVEQEMAFTPRSSFSKFERPMDDTDSTLERPPPTYLLPYTRSSAAQSIDNIESQRPVRPKSFTGASNRSTYDDPPPLITPRYPSDLCNFDFTDEGGPLISFIRASGVSGYPRSVTDSPRFGSIEIVRNHKE